jgi:hypothetical protein
MFYPFITDFVVLKIEVCECLYSNIMVNIQSIERELVLPYFSVMLEPDVVHLHHRYCSTQDWAWWVSVLKYHGEYEVERKRTCITVLFCNACARYCDPSAPISFSRRLSVVSVCIEISWWIYSRTKENLSYRIFL